LDIRCREAGAITLRTDNTERLRIDSSGRLLLGTSSSRSNYLFGGTAIAPLYQIESTGGGTAVGITRNSANSNGPSIYLGKSRGSAVGSNTAVASGDRLGSLSFNGADGSNLVQAARIDAEVDGTPGTNDMPGRLVFSTTADGASSTTERMRIGSNGNVGIGTSDPSSLLHIKSVGSAKTNVTLENSTTSTQKLVAGLTGVNNTGFSIYDDLLGETTFRIDNTGKVGIGTSSPDAKLSVTTSQNWNFPQVFLRRDASNIATNIKMIGFGLEADSSSQTPASSASFIGLNTDTAPTTGNTVLSQNAKLNLTSPGGVIMPVGNVGIGTSSPTEKLEVAGNVILDANNAKLNIKSGIGGTTGALNFTFNTNSTVFGALDLSYDTRATTGLRLWSDYPLTLETDATTLPIVFNQGASERLRIANGGNVGIGTSSPGRVLHVKGANNVIRAESTGAEARIEFQNADSTGSDKVSLGSVEDDMQLVAGGLERARIASNGNVGIGTSAPGAKLEVNGIDQTTSALDTSKLTVLVRSSALLANSGGSLGFGATTKQWAGIKGLVINGDNNSIGDLSFSTRRVITDSTLTEAMRIRHNGNVGIGTDSPNNILSIASATPRLEITDTTTSARFLIDAESSVGSVNFRADQDNAVANTAMAFTVDGSEAMRIDDDGNLGIGTTSPSYQLQLSTDSAGKPSTNTWTIVSDERIKEEIELADLDLCYEAVKNIPLKRFKWKDEVYTEEQAYDRRKLGWIAQDVEAVFPKAVRQHEFKYNQVFEEVVIPAVAEELDDDGNIVTEVQPERIEKGELISEDIIEDCRDLNSDQIYAAMYGAIQKLISKVEFLEAKVAALEAS
jgi:hypothetical protein